MSTGPASPSPSRPLRPSAGLQAGEVVLYERDGVVVTTKRISVDASLYPVASISSVRYEVRAGRVLNRPATAWVKGVLIAVIAAGWAWLAYDSGSAKAAAGLGAIAATLAGLVWVFVAVNRSRTEHTIILTTAGRDVRAVSYSSPESAAEVAAAIGRAIVG